jgi:hypothetical protein
MLTYCLFVYLDLIGGSFMAFYQKQIRNNHVNITSYSHILKNIQDCYNATRLKRRLDELQETTVEFTDDTSPGDASAELPTQLDRRKILMKVIFCLKKRVVTQIL